MKTEKVKYNEMIKAYKEDAKNSVLKFKKELNELEKTIIKCTSKELINNETINIVFNGILKKHKNIFGDWKE